MRLTIRLWWHETHYLFKPHNAVEVPTIGACYGFGFSFFALVVLFMKRPKYKMVLFKQLILLKMKSNELRIGNLVETDFSEGNIKTVVEIKHKMASVKYIRTDTNEPHQSMVDYERLVPIELTKEWLLKFGFNTEYKKGYIGIDVKHENGMTTDFVLSFPHRMGEWQTYFAWEFDNYKFQKLEYVHELQNLYFSLTGSELVSSTEP